MAEFMPQNSSDGFRVKCLPRAETVCPAQSYVDDSLIDGQSEDMVIVVARPLHENVSISLNACLYDARAIKFQILQCLDDAGDGIVDSAGRIVRQGIDKES